MSADRKKNATNLPVVVAKLLKTTKQLEAKVKALEGQIAELRQASGQPPAEPVDLEAPPTPSVTLPPGVTRRPAA